MDNKDNDKKPSDSGYLSLSFTDEHVSGVQQEFSCLSLQTPPQLERNEENLKKLFKPDKDGDTLLIVCICSDNLVKACNLINCCTCSDDLDHKNKSGQASIHFAAYLNQAEILSSLIRKGANMSSVDKDGQNLFHLIAKKGHIKSFVAVVTVCRELGKLQELFNVVNSANYEGHTPFYLAVKFQQKVMCSLMAETDYVDTNKPDLKNGNTPLHGILQHTVDLDADFILTLLDRCKVNVNSVNDFGVTPLHYAARYGHRVSCALLLAKGANPRMQDVNGLRPADYSESLDISMRLRELCS